MSKFRYIATIVAISALTFNAQAKDLKTEITVDRTIVPVEREATRLGSLTPQLLASPVHLRQLSLADYTEASEITRSASTLEPAAYADRLTLSPYRGYASLGYFPVFNLGASAGYKFIDNSTTRLGAWLQYDGCSYKSGYSDDKGSYSNNTFTIGATLDQRVGKKSALGAHLAYSHSAIGLPDEFINNRQNANTVDANLSWWSRSGTSGYHIKAAFSHFGYGKDYRPVNALDDQFIKAASENRININGGVAFFGSSATPRGGIELSADFLSRNNGIEEAYTNAMPGTASQACFQPVSAGTLGIISLTPYYSLHAGRLHARIGARIDVSVGGEGNKFHVAPAVMLDWNVASQFAIYAQINGGQHLNSLRSLFDYCPYTAGVWQYQRSNIPVAADLGFNIGPFTGFSARLFGGYAMADNWLMPRASELIASTGSYMLNSVSYGSYNLKGWHAGIAFSYDWRSIVKADLSAETASNGEDKAFYLWRDRAKYVINASVEVRPVDCLKIGLGYELRTDRHNYYLNGFAKSQIAVDLGSVSDLKINASYEFTPAFTVFARGENLLNHRYDLVTDIRAQGIRGLVGAAYKF